MLIQKISDTKDKLSHEFQEITIQYQKDKITYLTSLEKISKELLNIHNKVNTIKNNTSSSNINDEIMSLYLSSEFESMKEHLTKDLKNEFERKFEIEKLKLKNQKNSLIISLIIISTCSIVLSIFSYLY